MLLNFKEILFFLAICIASCSEEGNKDMYDYTSFHRWVRLQKTLSVADVEIDTVEKH